jgi:hypothetical protein
MSGAQQTIVWLFGLGLAAFLVALWIGARYGKRP